ncbi:MAG: rRNA maturation RNase YbeY [Lachnospiraceae bacterium]|jgi:probable rRNA maturation factor|nr:rRNA maturation RNase YbeY [Lachnospiraceae bacterium]MDD4524970.1 rRNA maturation RNase YbeY [Lachnospiraceae bacterium]
MKIILNTETDTKDKTDFSMKIAAGKVIRAALKQEKFPYDCEISLVITDSEGIRKMNREFRDIDKETDVLSFPGLTYNSPSCFESAVKDTADCMDPDNGCVVFGDIVINIDRVHSQAAEYGHSELREFSFLIAHSIMHLCGYDHMTEEESRVMEAKQEEVLSLLGITRN